MFGRKTIWLLGATLFVTALGGFVLTAVAMEEEYEEEETEDLLKVFEVLVADLAPPSKALEAALGDGAYPVVEFELETARSGGKRVVVWEVEFIKDGSMIECVVDARTGKVLETENEGEEEEAEEYLDYFRGAEVSARQAVKTVEGTIDGRILAAELDEEDDIPVYEFEVLANGRLMEIMVRLDNGKIMFDDEDDDDEDEEEEEDEE
jgi:uncharacterized membrane protein YkoI